MMLTVNLPPETESQVRRNAAELGLNTELYLHSLILEALHHPVPPIIPAKTSPEEFVRRLREVGRAVDPSAPPLSDEATRRESIYDHEGL